jgi:FkbM family methyltransferase
MLSVDNPLVTTRHKGSLFFGIYENAERDLAARYIDRSIPTVELGGSIGGVACIVNKLLDNPKSHVVLECNPILLPTLTRNRDLNAAHFTIEPFAIAYGAPSVSFRMSDHFMLGGTLNSGAGQTVIVPTVSLREILAKHQFSKINLISDCEGAEVDLIEHESELIKSCVKWLIVETHAMNVGDDAVSKMFARLAELGFKVRERSRNTVFALENCG